MVSMLNPNSNREDNRRGAQIKAQTGRIMIEPGQQPMTGDAPSTGLSAFGWVALLLLALTPLAAAGPSFDARLLAYGRAYLRIATEPAAMLDLMCIGTHRPGAAYTLRQAAARALDAPPARIAAGQAA